MLLHLTALNPMGELPQAVRNQKPLWYLLIVLLVITLVLRIIGVDLAGALLTGLMLTFAIIMVRDNMAQLERYNLVFGLLCSLNFLFDILPLLEMLGGRRSEEIRPTERVTVDGSGNEREETFSVTVKTSPFLDASKGLVYNAESLSLVFSAICMLMGALLSFWAHDIIMREAPQIDWDADLAGGAPVPLAGPRDQRRPLVMGGEGNNGGQRLGAYGANRSFDYFQGEGRRLSGADDAACAASSASAGGGPAARPAA